MLWLLDATISNAVIATAMAVVVVALSRCLRHRPAVVHAMWLIVLLKLVTPPLIGIPLSILGMPTSWATHPEQFSVDFTRDVPQERGVGNVANDVQAYSRADSAASAAATSAGPALAAAARELRWRVTSSVRLLVLVWVAASLLWIVLAAVRIARFSRLLHAARPCDDELVAAASRMARKLGLTRTPSLVMVDAHLPPLVWCAGRAARIVLPRELVAQGNCEQLELLLAHELAHVKRRDHLVRWLTLAVLAVYWWHPVAWWAVRRLRVAEEQCCDAMVVAASPARARAYAETLLTTLEFLAAQSRPPVLASGISSGGSLKRRCEMILDGQTKTGTGAIAGTLLLLVGIAVLPLAGVVQGQDNSDRKVIEDPLRSRDVQLNAAWKLFDQALTRPATDAKEEKPFPPTARWTARWDHKLDGKVVSHSFWELRLDLRNGKVGGRVLKISDGSSDKSIWSGQLITASGPAVKGEHTVPVLVLRQDAEGGYFVINTARRVSSDRFAGTWVDCLGQVGDFEITLIVSD